jgi:2-haloacid dehalogenase
VLFDTGGTVLDWHSGVTAGFEGAGRRAGVTADWGALANTWRRLSTDHVKLVTLENAGLMRENMDDVLRATLGATLQQHSVLGLEGEGEALLRAWRGSPAWPDASEGISLLRQRYTVAAFTILRTSLVIEASRRSGVQWDAVFSCEMTGVYKTAPAAYENVARWLDLPVSRILLAATHNNDISAARACGFRTAYIYRPTEWGSIPSADPEPGADAEMVAADILDLAHQLMIP